MIERRDFLGAVVAAFASLLLPWKISKRFHYEWYTTITIEASGELAGWTKPLERPVWSLLSSEFATVQPSPPSAHVFYMDYKYEKQSV